MSSVPIPFWPYNLASVAWFGIATMILIGACFPGNEYFIAYICTFLFIIFVVDILILGPLYFKIFNKRSEE
jgi:hypothetical protein